MKICLGILIIVTYVSTVRSQCVTQRDKIFRGSKIIDLYAPSPDFCCLECSHYASCSAWNYDGSNCELLSEVIGDAEHTENKICGRVTQNIPSTTPTSRPAPSTTISTTQPTTTSSKIVTTTEGKIPTTSSSAQITTPMSACLIEFGASYPGTDISSASAKNMFDCCNYCGVIPTCVAFIYKNTTSICTLKSQISWLGERVADPTLTFGKVQIRR